jgi:hypothetical protein
MRNLRLALLAHLGAESSAWQQEGHRRASYIVAQQSLYATILHSYRLTPLFARQMAVLAHHNNFRSTHYRNPAYPARYDPTC